MATTTSETLIERIHCLSDQEAWDRFYSIYAPFLKGFFLKRGCPASECDEIVQLTFVGFLKSLSKFRYNKQQGKFRTYLCHIAQCRLVDYRKKKSKSRLTESSTELEKSIEKKVDTSIDPPGKGLDIEWRRYILWLGFEQAKKRISKKGDPMTLRIIDLLFIGRKPPEKIVEIVNQEINTKNSQGNGEKEIKEVNRNKIDQDKSRFTKIWKEEVEKLIKELGEE